MDIKSIANTEIKDATILVRVDYNVALDKDGNIADDLRIRQTLPTLEKLLMLNNKLILCAHLGEPEKRDESLSLASVALYLQQLMKHPITLVDDFINEEGVKRITQQDKEIILLENLRFWPGEVSNDPDFAKSLAGLAEVFVQDAFGVCHRPHASVIGVPKLLPSYAGLLLIKEIAAIGEAMDNSGAPFVAILGGAKISTKIKLLYKLIDKADVLLLGGGMANTFLAAKDLPVGKSLYEKDELTEAQKIIGHARDKKMIIILPHDVIVQDSESRIVTKDSTEIKPDESIMDIGPLSREVFNKQIMSAKTIIWNGPMGKCEEKIFQSGTNSIYQAIIGNHGALSIVGGGDTIAAISGKTGIDQISHISTGGGAMIEFIEKGTLPGIDALKD